MGAFGQRLYVFPDHDTVIVMFGSHPKPVAALVDVPRHRAFGPLLARLQASK